MPDVISPALFDILACPKCKSDLAYNENKTELICTKCNFRYKIKEGIPVLLSK